MPTLLAVSSAYCRRLARERARNFYYGFLLLPRPRRDAFCAVYAFMRYCDDVADGSDSVAGKAALLKQWRHALDLAMAGDDGRTAGGESGGEIAESVILPAFRDAVQRYSIPPQYFHDLIDGAEMDLSVRTYRTFDDLRQYCYRVAGVVGLCSIHILGFYDPRAKKLAEECGLAFQLTNILRDLQEDARSGRVYLPLEDLDRFGYRPEQIAAGAYNAEFLALMQFEIARAKGFYENAYPLIDMVEPESRAALWALIAIYRGILESIERNRGNVFSRAARLTEIEKIEIVLRAAKMVAKTRARKWLRPQAELDPGWRSFRG